MSNRRDDARGSTAISLLAALAVGGLLGACNKQPITPTPVPTAAPTPAPLSPSIPQTGNTLSGVVFESTADGPRAVAGGFVDYRVDTGRGENRVSLDTNGRYTIPNLPDRSRIGVTAFGNGQLEQPCGAYAFVHGDTVRDIELVRPRTHGLSQTAPTLSGVVFHMTAEGRRPLANTRVVYYSVYQSTPFDAYTTTDSDGRYEVCGLPLGVGQLGAGDCNDQVALFPVEIRGDTSVLDVDLTPLIRDCPGVVIPSPTEAARREQGW
jgi:hypothetical protein